MKKKTGKLYWKYKKEVLDRTNVYRLKVEKMTCKENISYK